jgi:hypothetical protein
MTFWSRQIQIRKRIQKLLYGILEISIDLFGCQCAGGDERTRTADPLLAKQVLSQLSYIPDAREKRAISASKPAPPSACEALASPREVDQTLKSEEWERQDKTLSLFACALERKTLTDFHRELSRLPASN